MKTKLIASLFVLSVLAQGCVVVSDDTSEITVYNESSYVIEQLYITEVDTFSWGDDLLYGDVLFPGESITVGVYCDIYDIQVVDETGVPCELYDVDVCYDSAGWVIDDFTLDTCAWGVKATDSQGALKHDHVAPTSEAVEL
jgi:hypothetical protein